MSAQIQNKHRNLFATTWMWICAVPLLGSYGARAQPQLDAQCTQGMTHVQFLRFLDEAPRTQLARQQARETLVCIARRDNSVPSSGTEAVRVLFALCEDDAQARDVLLGLALDDTVAFPVHEVSCELLTLVSDPVSVRAILDRLTWTWPNDSRWQAYFRLLTDVGDGAFLEWLEQQLHGTEAGSPLHDFLERAATRVRIQRTPNAILAQMKADNCRLDCSWFVLQAFRHGIDAQVIRGAVLEALARPAEKRDDVGAQVALLRDCFKFGVLSGDDAKRFEELSDAAGRLRELEKRGDGDWATRSIEAKRATFYSLSRSDSEDK